MVFSSSIFIFLFLPVVFLLNFLVRKTKISNYFLLLASLVFYAWGEPIYVLIMIASIIINWLGGICVSKFDGGGKKLALAITIIIDLGILGFYKYAGFVVSTINKVLGSDFFAVPEIVLPIGISFFTFQAISYVIDVYRKDTEAAKSLVNVALYISFFPQLIAGPIVKYKEINKQIEQRTITFDGVALGFRRFIYGLGKKVLLANVLGLCVDTVYATDPAMIDPAAAWIAALAYTFQIYFDFSGYSDMAIGLGSMFGFKIPENFNQPYTSKSITEFWRRWHISLSSWFKYYLYIPLGGNRKGKARTYLNLVIVFFATGLWHGADWSFVIWGLYHGFFMVIERLGLKKYLDKTHVISRIYSMLVVILGWVLFRAANISSALTILAHMLMPWKYAAIAAIPLFTYCDLKTITVIVISIIGVAVLPAISPKLKEKFKSSIFETIFLIVVFILCIASIAASSYNPFIYFQF
ncbi:MAG: hypothetical protein MJ189_01865 [Coriobacteriales bacterium]|nr:hypothetical protein [Coriobacteriales bacterium]